MWFKKMAYISGYKSNIAVDGTDWRTGYNGKTWSASQTLPSAADANKYFYLPALGSYYNGQLSNVGIRGYYWSSGSYNSDSESARSMNFTSGGVGVYGSSRNLGLSVGGFK